MVRRRPKFPSGLKIIRKGNRLGVFVHNNRVGTIVRHRGIIPRWEVVQWNYPFDKEWFHQLPNAVLWACMSV